MKSIRINIEDTDTANKLETLLSLFGNDIEVISLKEGTPSQNKGDDYELFVGNVLANRDFQVIQTGKIFLIADHKVDLIAIKDDELMMIQCKNYDVSSPYQMEKQELIELEEHIDSFMKSYIWSFQKITDIQIRIFVSHDNILTQKAKDYCRNSARIKYRVCNEDNKEKYHDNTLMI
ncbi:restriction endonuclease [Helicobacter cappadocius]|uniref:Restriction endonuclease n=1 Tax=Helicobacter cappadocius TaxID=3063998 RepID=A0AA90Q244_9HELI|nr:MULTISPECIES: restriction endonuclease [unclassified Helicobacter]MDO7253061.1 restriction endonuclease [Helicobacter sp. faydin-H75]MDP2538813.1 restriction endonuclease [Helicobacter sp. faydin-H76]